MALINFGYRVDMSTIPSPLGSASFLVAYDLDGVLKQKDYQGIVSNITSSDSSKLDKGSYVGTAETLHNELLSLLPIGLRGQIIKIKNENSNQYETNELLLEGKFISNDTELEDAKINIITQEEIFNTWGRYSHGDATLNPVSAINSNLIPGTPLHTNSWFYNGSQSRIESTFNTGDIIGFVSNSLVKEYSQSATLGANNADNDRIGFCLFYEDLNDMVDNNAYGLNPASFSWAIDTTSLKIPNQHTLSFLRNRESSSTSFYVVYDNFKIGSQIIANGSANGVWNTLTNWNSGGNNTVDISVTRLENVITFLTSNFSDAPGGKGGLTFSLTIDLDSMPILEKFKGFCRYGFAAQSQANAYFVNIVTTEDTNTIFDVRNGEIWRLNNSGVYVIDNTSNLYDEQNRAFVYNKYTKKLFYIKNNNFELITEIPNIEQVLTVGNETSNIAVFNSSETVTSIGGDISFESRNESDDSKATLFSSQLQFSNINGDPIYTISKDGIFFNTSTNDATLLKTNIVNTGNSTVLMPIISNGQTKTLATLDDITSISVSNDFLPKQNSTGTLLVDSSLKETTTNVLINKKTEINSGEEGISGLKFSQLNNTPTRNNILFSSVGNKVFYASDGFVYVMNTGGNLSRYTTSGVGGAFGGTGDQPQDLVYDENSGNIYIANSSSNNVTKVTSAGTATILGTTSNSPSSIVVDNTGNVFTLNTNFGTRNITKITPAGVSTTFATSIGAGSTNRGMVIDGGNNIYISNDITNNITKITPAGVVSTLATTGNNPIDIALGSDYHLYVLNAGDNTVSKISTSTGVSTIVGSVGAGSSCIVLDYQNNIYTTSNSTLTVNKLTQSGVSTYWSSMANSSLSLSIDQGTGDIYYATFGSQVYKIYKSITLPKLLTLDSEGVVVLSTSTTPTSKILSSPHVNTTTTRTTVTEWTFDVSAGKTYKIEIIASYQTAATTTGGSLGFVLSSGATGNIVGKLDGEIVQTTGATGVRTTIRNIDTNNTTAGSFMTTTGVGVINSPHFIGGTVVFTCITDGLFLVQFASEVASSSAQLNQGSLLLITEL